MSTAASSRGIPLSATARQFGRAVVIALAAVAVGCVLCGAEKLLSTGNRFADRPAEVMMRAFGLAHFLIGWLFLFTSPRLREPVAVGRVAIGTALGIVLCLAFAWGGGTKNPLSVMLFYAYFLTHEVRDEISLSHRYGDGPRADPRLGRFYLELGAGVAILLSMLLASIFLLHGNAAERLPLPPASMAWIVFALFTTGLLLCARAWRRGLAIHGDMRALVAVQAPLLQVLAGLFAILAAGAILGTAGLHLVILVHVSVWLVFVHQDLAKKPPANSGLFTWLRRHPVGFVTLHLSLAALILVLFGLRTHCWQRDGLVSAVLAKSSFPYWGLLHISMAWWQGGRSKAPPFAATQSEGARRET